MLNNFDNDKNTHRVTRTPSYQLSPQAVYSIVHNNNNKYDNTLKKRNALVAFEFKKLVSRYNDNVTTQHYEMRTNSRGSTCESRSTSSNSSSSSSSSSTSSNESIQHSNGNMLPLNRNLNNMLSTSLTNLDNNSSRPQISASNEEKKCKSVILDENKVVRVDRKLSKIGKKKKK